jgi:G3E family GTPase
MAKAKMILVGGFLGAGKTTLLARATERLIRRGMRVGLITNDQAVNLVDTEILKATGQEVKEIAGACFCCAFNKLLYACDQLIAEYKPDVFLGEPVGSCTDLSATVLQRLKKYCTDRFDVAPYSVLTDPARLLEQTDGRDDGDMPQAVRYIYRKQLQEADLIVLNKTDTLAADALEQLKRRASEQFPGITTLTMSAATGEGVDEWLDRVLSGAPAGRRIAEVDYDTYAAGEAALGWLNAAVQLYSTSPADWKAYCLRFLRLAKKEFRSCSAEIAHLKILLTAAAGRIQGNLTSNDGEPAVQGRLTDKTHEAQLIVNARVRIEPDRLKATIEKCLRQAAGKSIHVDAKEMACFSPARPQPVHRFGEVV